jgi:hypothetical protein
MTSRRSGADPPVMADGGTQISRGASSNGTWTGIPLAGTRRQQLVASIVPISPRRTSGSDGARGSPTPVRGSDQPHAGTATTTPPTDMWRSGSVALATNSESSQVRRHWLGSVPGLEVGHEQNQLAGQNVHCQNLDAEEVSARTCLAQPQPPATSASWSAPKTAAFSAAPGPQVSRRSYFGDYGQLPSSLSLSDPDTFCFTFHDGGQGVRSHFGQDRSRADGVDGFTSIR